MEIKEISRQLSALAHEHRLAAFRLMVRAGPGGLAAGAVSQALDLPASSLSFHLSHLENAGLVSADRRGRNVFYSVRNDSVRGLLEFLTADCCQGRPELCPDIRPGCGSTAGESRQATGRG
ncbi:MAG: metalloregulator ArsR/SmtB family transcription factor [Gammaproteobacteria bacterium]